MSLGKKNIIKNISSKAQISHADSTIFLNNFLNILKNHCSKGSLKISKFGSFTKRTTAERIGRNPKTKETFIITKRDKIFFKPSNGVKIFLN
jgi:nucleoid DNA-binding protein